MIVPRGGAAKELGAATLGLNKLSWNSPAPIAFGLHGAPFLPPSPGAPNLPRGRVPLLPRGFFGAVAVSDRFVQNGRLRLPTPSFRIKRTKLRFLKRSAATPRAVAFPLGLLP